MSFVWVLFEGTSSKVASWIPMDIYNCFLNDVIWTTFKIKDENQQNFWLNPYTYSSSTYIHLYTYIITFFPTNVKANKLLDSSPFWFRDPR